jgi:magnesium-protoporphyrin O-methyltransferase
MHSETYLVRRRQIQTYFDRTAAAAWAALTTDAPLGRIRRTVREGRDAMRQTLLDWLPGDLRGRRILDAGCGTGLLAIEAARRGAHVLAIDLSPTLITLAQERAPKDLGSGSVRFQVDDMLSPSLGRFDHVVAMDSLIHYDTDDLAHALAELAGRTNGSLSFTFVPRTPTLAAIHAVGRLFPGSQRSPQLKPLGETRVREILGDTRELSRWTPARTQYISRGFYTSQALELVPA